jgi:predicted heme/steroid binding protein
MDEIQKVLVDAGHKDLAQKYYKKAANKGTISFNGRFYELGYVTFWGDNGFDGGNNLSKEMKEKAKLLADDIKDTGFDMKVLSGKVFAAHNNLIGKIHISPSSVENSYDFMDAMKKRGYTIK